jgi:hypothetical protein
LIYELIMLFESLKIWSDDVIKKVMHLWKSNGVNGMGVNFDTYCRLNCEACSQLQLGELKHRSNYNLGLLDTSLLDQMFDYWKEHWSH